MTIALWIIAMCETVRVVQTMIQIMFMNHDKGKRESIYSEFIKSLRMTDREWVKRMLEEYDGKE